MPSNRTLQYDIAMLASEKGVEAPTKGLNNSQLVALIKNLRTKRDSSESKVEPVEDSKPNGYYLAAGKAIVTRRGILWNGQEVKVTDVSGGVEILDNFVKTGHLKKG